MPKILIIDFFSFSIIMHQLLTEKIDIIYEYNIKNEENFEEEKKKLEQ